MYNNIYAVQPIPNKIERSHLTAKQGWLYAKDWSTWHSLEDGDVTHYNVFHASLLIRHDKNGESVPCSLL